MPNLVPEGDIYAFHAHGTLAILTKSLKNEQNSYPDPRGRSLIYTVWGLLKSGGIVDSTPPPIGGGGHSFHTPSDRGVIESTPPLIGGVIDSSPILRECFASRVWEAGGVHRFQTPLIRGVIDSKPLWLGGGGGHRFHTPFDRGVIDS